MSPLPPHTRVKICGITRSEDAHVAIEAGADALGFNTWQGSKRFLDLAQNAAWLSELPPFVCRVALMVNASLEEARAIASLPYIDAVQLHGDEDAHYVRELAATGRPVIKALRVSQVSDFEGVTEFAGATILLDAHVPGHYGGTGVAGDLALASEFRRRFPAQSLLLAGGLTPGNVKAAVAAVRPYAVDVSSGVESAPGIKDPSLVHSFIKAANEPA